MNEINFSRKNNEIECISYKAYNKAYPLHTHTNHIMLGTVEEGQVCVIQNGESTVYKKDEQFSILPNVAHEIKPVAQQPFSMMVLCIKTEKQLNDMYLDGLWEQMINCPENKLMIEDMANETGYSEFYLIRQFKKAYGLTPHQFQIQCKIRKAQRLLEECKSAVEVAYDTGFCDESHFDRCFQRVVKMTPSEYVESLEKK